jgi:glycosyltransferase involved in cell wall biosynthesis
VRLRPRVMHVTTTDISLVLLLGPQLDAIRRAGYEVVGVSAPGPYVGQLEALGITHVPLRHATRSMAPLHDLAALVELRSLFTRWRPDLVHTHNPKPGVYGRLAARAAGIPAIVNTVHGLYALPDDRLRKRAVVYSLEHVAARCSHAELVQNVEDMGVLRHIGVRPDKLHLLGNGIDLARFNAAAVPEETRASLRREWGIPADAIVCGVVGRLVHEKGYREVFEAARRLRSTAPNVHFVVVGPQDEHKGDALTAAEIAAAGREGNVHLVEARDDMEACYAAFDVYALASYREGFPRSAMEAAAMGLPVVATDIRGCRQVVDHGRTGLLVPRHDAPALGDAIAAIAGDADRRRAMAAAGVEKAAKEFDDQRCIDITLAVYEQLLRGPARSEVAA